MATYSFGSGLPTWNGIPMVGGIPMGVTKVFFVDYTIGSDGVSLKSNSVDRPFKTVARAMDAVTTDKNEGIALMGSASHVLTEMLSVIKNRMHLFGYDPGGRKYGQNAKISMGVTTAATDLAAMQNTGIRNSFRNLKFTSANTKAESVYGVVEAGEYAVYDFCEIYKETDLDVTGAAELVMNGDSAQVTNCTIGSLVNAIATAAIIRPNVLFTNGIVAGKVARDVTFENCKFLKKGGHVNNRYMYGANATDVERMLHIKDCLFFNNKLAVAVPAQCVAFGAEQSAGYVLIDNCISIGNTKLSTTTGVHITGPVPTYATSGIAVAS